METYALKGSMVRTPPMIPVSIPKSIPPKHAWIGLVDGANWGNEVKCKRKRAWKTDRAGKHVDSPSVDLLGVRSHRLIVDESPENVGHLVGVIVDRDLM